MLTVNLTTESGDKGLIFRTSNPTEPQYALESATKVLQLYGFYVDEQFRVYRRREDDLKYIGTLSVNIENSMIELDTIQKEV